MRSQETTPNTIQPYYLAWMKHAPEHPRCWESNWKTNWEYSVWIQSMHKKYKVEILKRNPDDKFDINMPYSKSEQHNFKDWLFLQVGITDDSVVL